MCGNIFINQTANHLLILEAMLVGVCFEKIYTTFSDRAKVIFTVFSLKTNWSGGGKKSLIARAVSRSTS